MLALTRAHKKRCKGTTIQAKKQKSEEIIDGHFLTFHESFSKSLY